MNSKSSENPANTAAVPVYLLPDRGRSDDISLIDLYRLIIKRKWVIALSVAISILLSLGYLYFAEPRYRAEARLLPPRHQDIQELMIASGSVAGLERLSPARVYEEFGKNLKSQQVRRAYFDMQRIIGEDDPEKADPQNDADRIFEDDFNNNVRVQIDKADPLFLTVSYTYRDSGLATEVLNGFVRFADKRTVAQLHGDINAAVEAEIKQIREQLRGKLKFAEEIKRDRVIQLREAMRIAEALGTETSYLALSDQYNNAISVNTAEVPLYMRGVRALQEEIATLESRKSEEPFIPGFRDLQEKLFYLESISIDPRNISTVRIDQDAMVPYGAEKPRKGRTILLVIVLGIIAGIFAAFFVELSSNARREQSP